MIYISAGHHLGDAGAVGSGYKEYQLCIELRDLVVNELKRLNAKYVTDKDHETLTAYINRIQPGSGSVLCEIHFNASASTSATGVEVIYPNNGSIESIHLAKDLSLQIAEALSLVNRGAKDESKTARQRLAVLRTKAGISVLPEICFISNPNDMKSYQAKKHSVAKIIACHLHYYDSLKN